MVLENPLDKDWVSSPAYVVLWTWKRCQHNDSNPTSCFWWHLPTDKMFVCSCHKGPRESHFHWGLIWSEPAHWQDRMLVFSAFEKTICLQICRGSEESEGLMHSETPGTALPASLALVGWLLFPGCKIHACPIKKAYTKGEQWSVKKILLLTWGNIHSPYF